MMRKLILNLLIVFFFLTSVFAQKKVVCYLDAEIPSSQVDPTICTHIIYSFLGLDSSGGLNYLSRSEQEVLSYIQDLVGFRAGNPDLKIIAAVGGWNEGLVPVWSGVAGDDGARSNFASNILKFIQDHDLNGIDIDWEYPNMYENAPQDKNNYIKLLQTIKQTIGSGYSLSVAIGTGSWRTGVSYDIPSVFQTVDFVNVMTYDLHGGWDKKTGIHGALYRSDKDPTDQNVDAAVKLILSQGGTKDKLIMGIPTYGDAFTLSDPNQNGVGAPASGAGSSKFNEICQKLNANSLTYVWDDDQKVPYAYTGTYWVGFDDVKSVTIKAQYIKDNNLGGAIIWDIDSDDHSNVCGMGNYPLISAIYHGVVGGNFKPRHKYSMNFDMKLAMNSDSKEANLSEKITSATGKFVSKIMSIFFKSENE